MTRTNDKDSYFELVSFIGGPATQRMGGVTEPNNNWPATTTIAGTSREVFATQAIRHLGLGTVPSDDALAANLIARGGYIQDYQWRGIDPVAVILPGYITVADGDKLYTRVTGSNADDNNLDLPIEVGTEVKAGTYPVKRGLIFATAGDRGVSGFNLASSTINEIWTPGYVEFGIWNMCTRFTLRSLTYLGANGSKITDWGLHLSNSYNNLLASLYYNASDPNLKDAFQAGNYLKIQNQSLIDTPTRLQPILANTFDPIISLPPSSYYPILHHQK